MSDFEPDFQIEAAGLWIATTPKEQRPKPVVIELRQRFGLDPVKAVAALGVANQIREARHVASTP